MRIVFAGGGTGGHIYPGIAVADETLSLFKEKNIPLEIYWIGSASGMDRGIVEKNLLSEGGSITAFYGISCGKLRRYFSFQNLVDVFKILHGFFQAVRLLKKLKPDFLFSKGGFVSVPPCRAAKLLGIPYFTHECDFTPGLATRLNAASADKVLVSYEATKNYLKEALQKKCVVTGNPVRPVFYENLRESGRQFLGIPKDEKKPLLFIQGGSLGARQINDLVVENLDWLKERFIVVHQTGKAFAEERPDVMKMKDSSYMPFAFIHSEMPSVLQAADLVLSRSGANSLWECVVCEKPMVLIPLCGSGTRGDQVDNARYVEERGCAKVLAGPEATSENLRAALEVFLSEEERNKCSAACKVLKGDERAARKIANLILNR